MRALPPIGRVLFSAIFLLSGLNHLQNREAMTGYAASAGLPFPEFAVLASGVVILFGGVLVLLGLYTRFGAALLAAFLLTAAFSMHDFWNYTDPMEVQMQTINFMKNLSMAGGAFLILYFGAGPFSLDRKLRAIEAEGRVPLRERTVEP